MKVNVTNPCVATHSTRTMPLAGLGWHLVARVLSMDLLAELSQSLIPLKTAKNQGFQRIPLMLSHFCDRRS